MAARVRWDRDDAAEHALDIGPRATPAAARAATFSPGSTWTRRGCGEAGLQAPRPAQRRRQRRRARGKRVGQLTEVTRTPAARQVKGTVVARGSHRPRKRAPIEWYQRRRAVRVAKGRRNDTKGGGVSVRLGDVPIDGHVPGRGGDPEAHSVDLLRSDDLAA